jgi:hypothetical protein
MLKNNIKKKLHSLERQLHTKNPHFGASQTSLKFQSFSP